jgi:hypothetical protein
MDGLCVDQGRPHKQINRLDHDRANCVEPTANNTRQPERVTITRRLAGADQSEATAASEAPMRQPTAGRERWKPKVETHSGSMQSTTARPACRRRPGYLGLNFAGEKNKTISE